MDFRKARTDDLKDIGGIIAMARKSLHDDGVDQWQKTNPNIEIVKKQLANKGSYVLEENGKVVGYAFLSPAVEETYTIYEDRFKGKNYLVVHTMMVDASGKIPSLGTKFMEKVLDFAQKSARDSLRIDTHEDNFRMRGLLAKFDFRELGQIHIDEDGTPKARICYEKVL